ncbi:hypothetical protein [Natronomonas sp.]|uniref:hypothetical protein n=1 Tax=Natronomonas sp. TaxID=2184060 RepID=UPI002FC3B155
MSEAYSGVFGAVPYAFRQSRSRAFRVYAVLGGLLAGLLGVFFTFALVVSIATTANLSGGTVTFVRSVFVFFGFLVTAPLLAPILLVARHHRREGNDTRYDTALAAAGGGYLVTLYLGAIASMPAEFTIDGEVTTRPTPSGATAPLVEALYAMPESLSWLLPLVGAVGIYLVHRWFR